MTTWARGNYGALASMNLYFHQNLSARTAFCPTVFTGAWQTAPAESAFLRYDWGDDVPLNPPCFSLWHHEPSQEPGSDLIASPTGGVARLQHHTTEISVWHRRVNAGTGGADSGAMRPNWQMELRQMRDMVVHLLHSARGTIPWIDPYQGNVAPFVTAGRLLVREIRSVEAPHDPNPSIERSRMLCIWDSLETL